MGISLLLLLFTCSIVCGQNSKKASAQEKVGMNFIHTDWDKAKELAKKENKYIVADVYAYWCGPCKKMDRETFVNPKVADFYNKNFISFKIDMGRDENKAMNSVFKVQAFPTVVYYNPDGEEVYRFKGFRPPQMFLQEGKKALFDNAKYAEYQEQFKNGKKSEDFLYEFITFMGYGGKTDKDVIDTYLKKQSKKDLLNEKNMELIYGSVQNSDSPFFKLLLDNKTAYEEKYGHDEVNLQLRNIALNDLRKALADKDEKRFKQSIDVVEHITLDGKELLKLQMQLEYYVKMEDWKKYAATSTDYLDNNELDQHALLNNIAWTFYENIEDKEQLAKAEKWIRDAIQLRREYNYLDTLAALLFKQGKKEEGMEMAQNAIELAKKTRKNPKPTHDLIKKYTD